MPVADCIVIGPEAGLLVMLSERHLVGRLTRPRPLFMPEWRAAKGRLREASVYTGPMGPRDVLLITAGRPVMADDRSD